MKKLYICIISVFVLVALSTAFSGSIECPPFIFCNAKEAGDLDKQCRTPQGFKPRFNSQIIGPNVAGIKLIIARIYQDKPMTCEYSPKEGEQTSSAFIYDSKATNIDVEKTKNVFKEQWGDFNSCTGPVCSAMLK